MNDVERLLQSLCAAGIRLWPHEGKLRYRGAAAQITPELLSQLQQHKAALLQHLCEPTYAPLSHGQRGLWYIQQSAPDNFAYHVTMALRIYSELDLTLLHNTLQLLVNRHAALRTTFPVQDHVPVQKIAGYQQADFQVVDASTWTEEQLLGQLNAEHERPFDLATGPLSRVLVYARAPHDHVLLMSVHHIVTDGWSAYLLLDELFRLYAALQQGVTAQLPIIEHTYADFVHWQQTLLQREGERLWAYWQEQVSGDLPVLQLPTDYPRPPLQRYEGVSHTFELSARLTQQLKQLAQQNGSTLHMVLLAAYQIWLYRYSGQDDLLIGSPVVGRSKPEFANLVGYFVSAVVTRAHLHDQLTFCELLAQVRRQVLSGLDHQDYPFSRLVEQLNPARDPSRSPIFQAGFGFLKPQQAQELVVARGKIKWFGLLVERIPLAVGEGQQDITLDMIETPTGLRGMLYGNAGLFAPATIKRMAGHFQTLLQGIVDNPDQSIVHLPLLTEAERHQLLMLWNDTAVDYPRDKCVHQLFEEQVERTPDALAVVFAASGELQPATLTYHELNVRANQLAHHLQSLGIGPDTLVGLCVERSLEMIIALLGILKAGGAYIPLDPGYPQERLTYMLETADAPLLISLSHLRARLPTGAIQCVWLDTDWPQIAVHPSHNPACAVQPANLAYVIYTSGSTGAPKGVMIPQRGLAHYALAMRKNFQLTPVDRFLQFMSITFDVAGEEIYSTLIAGATLVLRTEQMLESIPTFLDACRAQGITVLDLPTAYWHQLTRDLSEPGVCFPPSVRQVITGGERVSPEIWVAWQRQMGCTVRLLNVYGPTEITVACLFSELSAREATANREVPIGRPIQNMRAYILDRWMQPVPIGVPGELYIGGVGLALGYLKQPALTAESFIHDPFSSEPGACLYRTGDQVCYLPDGTIEFLGRIDHQVKIRGYRIELKEIEAAINQHPAVQDSVVLVHEDEDGNKGLVAYLMSKSPLVRATIRQLLQQKLPGYMVPSAFVLLDTFPLTASGKVDRKALAAMPLDRAGQASAEASFVAPSTPMEQQLAEIWRRLLRLERVGVYDNFFTVGGDSILSMQVVSHARQLGIPLSAQQIFQHQTIAELSARLEQQGNGHFSTNGHPPALLPWTPDAPVLTGEDAPLTPIQHFWAALALPGPHVFNLSTLLELDPRVDTDRLCRALQILFRYHDAMRLRFQQTATGWRQELSAPTDEVPLQEIDVTGLSAPAFQQKMSEVTAVIERAINLQQGPLLGLVLLRRQGESCHLLWIMHHLIVDRVSWRILLADLETVYQQLGQAQAVQLPPKTTTLQQWARWLQERGPALVGHEVAYWVARYQDIQPLPVDCPAGEPTWASLRVAIAALSPAETQALLQQAPAAYQTQINDLLLTALLQTFVAWSGHPSLLIELEGHGRDLFSEPLADRQQHEAEMDLSRTVGWVTSTFPVRLDHQPGELGALIGAVKEQLRQIPNRGLGFGILRYLEQAPGLTTLPLPAVCFNYLGQFDQPATAVTSAGKVSETRSLIRGMVMAGFAAPEAWQAFHTTEFLRQNGQARFPNLFELVLAVVEGELQLCWIYSANVHQPSTVERLAGEFMRHLRTVIAHCQQQIQMRKLVAA